MKLCTADARPPAFTAAELFARICRFYERKTCDKPAVYMTIFGPRCIACGEAVVDAAMGDETLIGMLLEGQKIRTREELHKRLLRTFQ